MDASIWINELQTIVVRDAAYVGPHADPLAHVYGVASQLRDIASTDRQREAIAIAVAEFKRWFKGKPGATAERKEREHRDVMAALAGLRREYGA
jgi:hypothetical protein